MGCSAAWMATSLAGACASLFAAFVAVRAIRRQDRELELLGGLHDRAESLKKPRQRGVDELP